ncbi:hypothetical protein ISCGN_007199 [Ixodes scapularis]
MAARFMLVSAVLVAFLAIAFVYFEPIPVEKYPSAVQKVHNKLLESGRFLSSLFCGTKRITAEGVFTAEELRKYDGTSDVHGLYLALLGRIYDVQKGAEHYRPGGGYAHFAGRDASRAYVTGDFSEAGLTDDLQGLSDESLHTFTQWVDFYEKDYRFVDMGLDLGRHDKGGDELVQCEGCGRWCYLEETGFGSLEVAAEVSFECRLCVKLQQVTGEWEGRVREIEAQLKAEGEKRVGLEAQVEELTRQLNHEREQRVGLEKQAEELGEVWKAGLEERKRECDSRVERLEGVIRASESSEGRKEEVSVLAGRTTSLQAGVPGGRESGLLAGGLDDAGELIEPQLNGAFEQQASGSQVTGDKSQDKGAQAPGGSRVLVVGSSNVARVRRGVHNRVKGDQRVTVEVQPGKCMVDAMTAAREGVWDNREGRNLVIVHAGLNDVLKGRSQNLGKQLNVGIRKLRDVSENVHVVVCTIPEVRGQSGLTERRVVEANGVIKGMSRQLRYDVMEVNREVYEAGSRPFADGIHYSEATGYRVGDRMGRTVTAFLGGPRALGALK